MTAPTFTALTTLRDKTAAGHLGTAMEALIPEPTAVAIEEVNEDTGLWEVSGYFCAPPDEAGLALLAASFKASPFVVSELPETDWVAHVRRALAPIRAGRFFLYGSHDADKVPSDVVALAIDAALAFGTGHHATTQGCLIALDRLALGGVAPASVADIGCGTAVLAMAAAKIWPDTLIIASDIDDIAVETATENLRLNGLDGAFPCVTCAGFDDPALAAAHPFDLVFANILKAPLMALAPDMARMISTGGYAILSGILNTQAADVIARYAPLGFVVARHDKLAEWSTLTLQKTGK